MMRRNITAQPPPVARAAVLDDLCASWCWRLRLWRLRPTHGDCAWAPRWRVSARSTRHLSRSFG